MDDNVNTKILADVIVDIKEGKIYKAKDNKSWYLLEPIGLQKNGLSIKYKGLNQKADNGVTDEVVDSITSVINLNTDSYSDRRENFKEVIKVIKVINVNKCSNR